MSRVGGIESLTVEVGPSDINRDDENGLYWIDTIVRPSGDWPYHAPELADYVEIIAHSLLKANLTEHVLGLAEKFDLKPRNVALARVPITFCEPMTMIVHHVLY